MAQILVPVSDHSVGSWTTSPLFSKVGDNSTVSSTGDGQVIQSDIVTNNSDTTNAILKLASGLPPLVGTHTLRVRWRGNVSGRSLQATCELWQGDPLGAGTKVGEIISATNVGTTEVLASTTTISTITDYTDLYVVLRGRGTGGGAARGLEVELVELEVPDASPLDAFATQATSMGWTVTSQDANTVVVQLDGVQMLAEYYPGVQEQVRCAFVDGFLSWDQSTYRSADLTGIWTDSVAVEQRMTGMDNRLRPHVNNGGQ